MVKAPVKSDGVFAEKSSRRAVVISGAVIAKTSLRIIIPTGVLERICKAAAGVREIAKRVVNVGIGQRSDTGAKRGDRVQPILPIVTGGAGTEFRERLVLHRP